MSNHLETTEQTILFPLEEFLKKCNSYPEKGTHFPKLEVNYYLNYCRAKDFVTKQYYENLDLAAGLSGKDGTVYTHHGLSHTNNLIMHAGYLLNLKNNKTSCALNGYECYLLLMAILVHDLGMYIDRDNHQDQCETMTLSHLDDFCINSLQEAKSIGKIGAAHSGRDTKTRKNIDTLKKLSPKGKADSIRYREQAIAAVVRFVDELSEYPDRSKKFTQYSCKVNDDSKMRHKYCSAVTNIEIDLDSQAVIIEYYISADEALKVYKVDGDDKIFINYVVERLIKMDLERAYCTRYFSQVVYISSIKASFHIYVNAKNTALQNTLVEESIILGETGYPDSKYSTSKIFDVVSSDSIEKKREYFLNAGKTELKEED